MAAPVDIRTQGLAHEALVEERREAAQFPRAEGRVAADSRREALLAAVDKPAVGRSPG